MDKQTREYILDALQGLTTANWLAFGNSPALCCEYERNLRSGRHVYVDDAITCGEADCWSLYRDLCERYRGRKIELDCEDAASAHAAWLVSRCYRGISVGFVPAPQISHAVVGVKQGGKMRIVDPCIWYGMGSTTYDGVVWRELVPELSRGKKS